MKRKQGIFLSKKLEWKIFEEKKCLLLLFFYVLEMSICVHISKERIKLVLKISLAHINDLAHPMETILEGQTLSNSRGQT